MSDDLIERLISLADCDARSGAPLGKVMREAAAEIGRLQKHIAIMHDVADQRDTLILERDATIARMKKDAEDGAPALVAPDTGGAVDGEWACQGGTRMHCHVFCTCDGSKAEEIDPRL